MIKKQKNKDPEFIAMSTRNKQYKIKNIFSEELKINHKKQDIQLMDDENGFTYILFKNKNFRFLNPEILNSHP